MPLARLVRRLVLRMIPWLLLRNFQLNFAPSQRSALLALPPPRRTAPAVVLVFSSTPLPGFAGKDFLTTTGSSATLQSVSTFLSHLVSVDYHGMNSAGLPRLISGPWKRSHPQTRTRFVRVWGVALIGRLTHRASRIRFACAMYRFLPIASFRPFRYQKRPCDSD